MKIDFDATQMEAGGDLLTVNASSLALNGNDPPPEIIVELTDEDDNHTCEIRYALVENTGPDGSPTGWHYKYVPENFRHLIVWNK